MKPKNKYTAQDLALSDLSIAAKGILFALQASPLKCFPMGDLWITAEEFDACERAIQELEAFEIISVYEIVDKSNEPLDKLIRLNKSHVTSDVFNAYS